MTLKRSIKDIDKIIIHCSDSNFGDVDIINKWHKERGFDKIGYHFIITNGVIKSHNLYKNEFDGIIQRGRKINEIGAHCIGQNKSSIGICLIGIKNFTDNQIKKLICLINVLGDLYEIPKQNVFGHYEFNNKKSCPNLNMDYFRKEFI